MLDTFNFFQKHTVNYDNSYCLLLLINKSIPAYCSTELLIFQGLYKR